MTKLPFSFWRKNSSAPVEDRHPAPTNSHVRHSYLLPDVLFYGLVLWVIQEALLPFTVAGFFLTGLLAGFAFDWTLERVLVWLKKSPAWIRQGPDYPHNCLFSCKVIVCVTIVLCMLVEINFPDPSPYSWIHGYIPLGSAFVLSHFVAEIVRCVGWRVFLRGKA